MPTEEKKSRRSIKMNKNLRLELSVARFQSAWQQLQMDRFHCTQSECLILLVGETFVTFAVVSDVPDLIRLCCSFLDIRISLLSCSIYERKCVSLSNTIVLHLIIIFVHSHIGNRIQKHHHFRIVLQERKWLANIQCQIVCIAALCAIPLRWWPHWNGNNAEMNSG